MSPASIPGWNSQGILPPINPTSPASVDRSPYFVTVTDLALRFGISTPRQQILTGFIKFRAALHSAGLTRGFQWVDGSFLENIEIIETRSPADIDIVTFFHLPEPESQEGLVKKHPNLFDHDRIKAEFHVDSYFVQLNGNAPEPLVEQSTYWYSLWSHRRNGLWKGYLQIDLAPLDDGVAEANLSKMLDEGGQP